MISRRTRKDIRRSRERRALTRTIKSSIVAAACGLWTLAPSAFALDANALPSGGQPVGGEVSIPANPEMVDGRTTLNITQTSDRAIIKWDSFNIGENATVNFIQKKDGVQNTAAMTLNRVATTGGMSEIYGKINSIGSVILINPNGVMFAKGSEVNAAGIVASTADIKDDTAFINNGELTFLQDKTHNNNITVNGKLNAAINGAYLDSNVAGSYGAYLANSTLNLGTRQVVKEIATVGNKIMLVADGDIEVGADAALTATTITNTAESTSTVTQDGFTLTKDIAADRAEGTIILRADQNADDVNASGTAATITLNNDQKNFQGVNVKLYYNDEITTDGVNGTTTASIGINGATADKFTMKNYASGYGDTLKGKLADTVSTSENTAGSLTTRTGSAKTNKKAYSLINNIYQLQAIDDQNKATYLGYNYALGRDIDAADTAKWTTFDGNSGFDPIGLSDVSTNRGLNYKGSNWRTYNFPVAFKGEFTGNGGTGSYSIYDLNIKRTLNATKNYIGLFAVTYGATISDLTIVEPVISGYYDIGSVVGYAHSSKLENLTARKRVADLDGKTSTLTTANISGYANMGGIVGTSVYTSIYNCVNSTQIAGQEYIGGITGTALNDHHDGSAAIDSCINKGYYSPNETVAQGYGVINATGSYIGGLAGIIAYAGETATITNSYSNGQVYGKDYVGGLIGRMDNGTASITNSYNSNEAEPGKATIIADENAEQSIYGKVVANGASAGGIIGAAGAINNNSKPNITIANVYNSGNVTATTNAGGIVGYFGGGTLKISNSYNADNNTVLKDTNNYSGFKCNDANGATREYVYDSTTQKWYAKDASATQYSEKELEKIAPMSERLYNTRLAYRDATVTTSVAAANAGGIIGYAGAGVTLENTYSAGKVYDTSTNTTKVAGGLVGTAATGAKANGTNFYITEQNVTGSISGDVATVVYSGTLAGTGTAEGWTLWKAQNTAFGDSKIWYYSPGSTTPLLKNFMTGTVSAGKTQYVYDGSAHLVDTSLVASGFTTNGMGYYGNGAFSTGVNGDNFGRGVNVKNKATTKATVTQLKDIDYGTNADGITATDDDDTSSSHFYSYAQSNLWSPQHGYMTDESRGLVITPKKITYDLTKDNEKTYGEAVDASNFGEFKGLLDSDKALITGSLGNDDYLVATDASARATKLTYKTAAGDDYILTADEAKVRAIISNSFADTGNYTLDTINAGTITINQRELTYTITGATKTYGNTTLDSLTGTWSGYITDDAGDFGSKIDASKATGVINSAGMDEDAEVGPYTDVKLADPSAINALLTNKNYKIKPSDVTIDPGAVLTVIPRSSGGGDAEPERPHYEPRYDWPREADSLRQPKSNRSDLGGDAIVSRRQGIIGGVIPDEARTQIRFLTIIDSGINIGAAPEAIDHITIDPTSYAAESDEEKRLKQ